MNDATVHLIIAHVPVVGSVFVLALLAGAAWRAERVLWQCGILAAVAMALAAIVAMTSGPPAQAHVRPWLDPDGIALARRHEITGQIATGFVVLVAAFGAQAWMGCDARGPRSPLLRRALLASAAAAVIATTLTAAFGGRIRHTELRSPAPTTVSDEVHAPVSER